MMPQVFAELCNLLRYKILLGVQFAENLPINYTGGHCRSVIAPRDFSKSL